MQTTTQTPTSIHNGSTTQPERLPRRLLVVGATGSLGRALVARALEQGHHVTAFARRPQALEVQHPRLTLHAGDVFDADSVKGAVPGHDVVLVALGASPLNRSRVRALGTHHVVGAMQTAGVRRLICLSILGLGESYQNLPLSYKALVKPGLLRFVYQDHEAQEAAVQASDLDWTLVRPPNFTEGDATGAYRHGFAGDVRDITLKISRADLADFMLAQVDDDTYLRACPALSY